jgi:hypothetical protein
MRAIRESSYPAALPWLAAAVPWLCILARGVPGGDDWQLEVARVAAYSYAWSDVQWPPFWAPDLYGGYGSPIFLFYGHTCLAIASLFVLVTRNFTFALMLALASAGLFGVFSVRRAAAALLPGAEGAAAGRVAACVLLLNPYLLGDLLLRNASAEYSALCAMPLALAGLWLLRHDDRRGALCIAAGTGLVIATHALSALVACALLLGLAPSALLTAAQVQRVSARSRWLGMALGLGLGIALTGYAWLPALSLSGLIRTEDLLAGKFHYRDQMPALRPLFDGSTFYSAGPLPLLAVAAAAFSLRTTRLERGIAGQATGASSATHDPTRATVMSLLIAFGALVFVQTQLSVPLWEHLPGMRYFQFPWRFMGPLAIVTALLAGLAFARLTRALRSARRSQLELVIWSVCVLAALPQLSRAHGLSAPEVARLEGMLQRESLRRLRFTATARDEYLPRGSLPNAIQRPAVDEPIPAASAGLRVTIRKDEPRYVVLDVRALSDGRLCLARWGFPFWEVRVDDQLQPPQSCAGGCLGVRVAQGRHHIVASLPVPQPRVFGLLLSGLGLLGTWLLVRRRTHAG